MRFKEPTDQRDAGSALGPARRPFGVVAPSQVDIPIGNQNDDFAVIKGVIPDTSCFRPVGQEPWGSSYKGHGVDALAPRADEGRGRLRKASGSREQTLIRGCPNGETHAFEECVPLCRGV